MKPETANMYYIVANPNSERGSAIFLLSALTAHFENAGIPYDTYITTKQGDAYRKTLKFCKETYSPGGVIVIGGDGTLQEVVAGMYEAFPSADKIPIPLGILPSSTGSDFFLSLKGGKHFAKALFSKDISERCRSLFESVANNQLRPIDIGTANGMAFLNIAHIGLDAQIVANADELKEKYDRESYLAAAYKSISRHKNLNLTLEITNGIEQEKSEGKYALIAVANGQYYGGGMRICPDAQIDDGKFTMCVVQGMSRIKLMMIFPSVLFEKHHLIKDVGFMESESVKITLQEQGIMCLDGNIYPCKEELVLRILPKVLNVFM